MTINSASIPVDATITPSAGTATTLKTKSNDGALHVVFLDDGADLLTQSVMEFSYKEPKAQSGAPNGYSQARNTVVIKKPLALDNGNRTVNTLRIEFAGDVEMTAAEKLSLRTLGVLALSDSDFTEFWDDQSAA